MATPVSCSLSILDVDSLQIFVNEYVEEPPLMEHFVRGVVVYMRQPKGRIMGFGFRGRQMYILADREWASQRPRMKVTKDSL